MKKFVFLYVGAQTPTAEINAAWRSWFGAISDKLVDAGNPFGAGREVTPTAAHPLPQDASSITGYTIINAASMAEAVAIAQTCPMVNAIHVYEAQPM